MATIDETIWVNNDTELHNTVQTLVGQGGTVMSQSEGAITVEVKRKLNVVMLIVLLVLFCLPGLVYLLWHFTANANQVVTVRVGQPSNIGGYRPETQPGAPTPGQPGGVQPGGVQDAVGPPASLPQGGTDPWMVPPATPSYGVQDAVIPAPPPSGPPPGPPPPPPTGF